MEGGDVKAGEWLPGSVLGLFRFLCLEVVWGLFRVEGLEVVFCLLRI